MLYTTTTIDDVLLYMNRYVMLSHHVLIVVLNLLSLKCGVKRECHCAYNVTDTTRYLLAQLRTCRFFIAVIQKSLRGIWMINGYFQSDQVFLK